MTHVLMPEFELTNEIRERLNETQIRENTNETLDPFEGRRISAKEVPADIRRQARKDRKVK